MGAALPLTIAIPVYKRAHAIIPLLQAIDAQSAPEDDLVILDDASGDDIQAAVERSATRFRLIVHPTNLGMVENWNECFRAARHSWVGIVHHDDVVGPQAVATWRAACQAAGQPALIAHRRYGGDEQFRYRWSEAGPWASMNVPGIPSGVVVHRQIVEAVGGFDPQWKYSSDLEYFPRICAKYPLLIIESPDVVRVQLHARNYQYETWLRPDFEAQMRAIQALIVGYAGLAGRAAGAETKSRLRGIFIYMFMRARALGDPALLRKTGALLRGDHALNWRLRLLAGLAARTGVCPAGTEGRVDGIDVDNAAPAPDFIATR